MKNPETKVETNQATASKTQQMNIKAPDLRIVTFDLVGTAPLVMHKFSAKAKQQIIATQMEGGRAKSKAGPRAPKDFDEVFKGAMHIATEGWIGVPASAFRNAMISACRTVGFHMTRAKLACFVLADGVDADDGVPLVKIDGDPERHTTYARNDNGSVDIRVRPMWKQWTMKVSIRYDADMFSAEDVANLMVRVGMQVGILEGRPDSKNSAGMGWGLFSIASRADSKVVNG